MTDDDGGEFDISNPLLNEYMSQFVSDSKLDSDPIATTTTNFKLHDEDLDESHTDTCVDSTTSDERIAPKTTTTSPATSPFAFLFDMRKVVALLDEPSQSFLLDDDKKFVLTTYMNHLSTSNQSSTNMFQCLRLLARDPLLHILLLVGVVLVSAWQLYLLVAWTAVAACLVAAVLCQAELGRRFLSAYTRSINTHVECTRQLVYYLKEIELVNLSTWRAHSLDALQRKRRNASKSEHHKDEWNYAFRRLAFTQLRANFHSLRAFNLQLLALRRPIRSEYEWKQAFKDNNADEHHEQLICTIEPDELADLLDATASNTNIDELTDSFSLACITTLNKLNKMLLSESFKLATLVYIQHAYNGNGNCSTWRCFVTNGARIAVAYGRSLHTLRHMSERVERVLDTSKLLLPLDSTQVTQQQQQQRVHSAPRSREHELALALRNTLLNVDELERCNATGAGEERKELLLGVLDTNMRQCQSCYEQLSSDCDKPSSSSQATSRGHDVTLKSATPVMVEVRVGAEARVQVDEIFEAEVVEEETEEKARRGKHDDGDESMLMRKRASDHKNLYYELTYALKSKRNEWREREKTAASNQPQRAAAACNEEADEHLLENDALKYKSTLRRRRRTVWSNKQQHESTTTIDEEDTKGGRGKYKYVESEESDRQQPAAASSFLQELMSKRSNLFGTRSILDEEDEEILAD